MQTDFQPSPIRELAWDDKVSMEKKKKSLGSLQEVRNTYARWKGLCSRYST